MIAEEVQARSAIESLRSGVPSRYAVAQLGTTQQEVKAAFETALESAAEGRGTAPIALSANFGAGKSHLLTYLQGIAEQRQFVTAYVVVSPEMPMGNAHLVLRAIAENARAPGHLGNALRAVAADFNAASPPFARLRHWAREAGLNGRFEALLRLYEEYRADPELRALILDDFEGKLLPKSVIRRHLNEIGELAAYDLTGPTRKTQLAHDRIRLLAQCFRAGNCRGIVVLIDEVERIAKFSANQRGAAYQELGWWSEIAEQEESGILPVFALTDEFAQEFVIGGRRDPQRFFSSVMGFGQEEGDFQEERSRRGSRGIEVLKSPYLLTSDADQDEEIKYRIKAIYQQAYGVRVRDLPPARSDVRTTIRSEIRKWITLWDMQRYYPDYAVQMEEEAIPTDVNEIPDEMLGTADEEESGA